MSRITVVGSFVMDLIGTVDQFPLDGQTIIGKTFNTMPGGKGANQAVAAARLGGDVSMVGRVGDDAYGKIFLELFKAEGIHTDCVQALEGFPTGVGLIQINSKAENKIVVIPGANYGYTVDDLLADVHEIIQSEYVVLQLELLHDVTAKTIELCASAGVKLILNPAPAVPLNKEILSKVTYLTPNETELEILSGIKVDTIEDAKEAVKMLLDIGVEHVVATLGKNGALVGDKDGFRHISGYEVQAIDTVAAGDSFNGALVTALSKGETLDDAVKYANAVGALTVTKKGAIPSLPTEKEVENFIKDHNTFK